MCRSARLGFSRMRLCTRQTGEDFVKRIQKDNDYFMRTSGTLVRSCNDDRTERPFLEHEQVLGLAPLPLYSYGEPLKSALQALCRMNRLSPMRLIRCIW